MLDGAENKSKQDKSLAVWVEAESKRLGLDRNRILDRCLIPQDVSLDFAAFADFAVKRSALLAEKLTERLR